VRERAVVFAPEARDDLISLYDWIAIKADPTTALSYIQRLEKYCLGFTVASERGHLREDIRPNLRIVGFERRITIAFTVTEDEVTILRLYSGGRNWEADIE
jgi:toxin ParE1/3/4